MLAKSIISYAECSQNFMEKFRGGDGENRYEAYSHKILE